LEDRDEDQWRQVHPRFVDGDVVSREAFAGTSSASDEVSTARGAIVSAAAACEYHRHSLGLASAGSWPVSIDQVDRSGARVIDDSGCDEIETPGHSFIDLRGMSKADRRKVRTALAAHATARGPSFK
jgi:hypothetical protein